jgi:hypothetical protein
VETWIVKSTETAIIPMRQTDYSGMLRDAETAREPKITMSKNDSDSSIRDFSCTWTSASIFEASATDTPMENHQLDSLLRASCAIVFTLC